jgi:hypothetical protein
MVQEKIVYDEEKTERKLIREPIHCDISVNEEDNKIIGLSKEKPNNY